MERWRQRLVRGVYLQRDGEGCQTCVQTLPLEVPIKHTKIQGDRKESKKGKGDGQSGGKEKEIGNSEKGRWGGLIRRLRAVRTLEQGAPFTPVGFLKSDQPWDRLQAWGRVCFWRDRTIFCHHSVRCWKSGSPSNVGTCVSGCLLSSCFWLQCSPYQYLSTRKVLRCVI